MKNEWNKTEWNKTLYPSSRSPDMDKSTVNKALNFHVGFADVSY